MTKHGGTRQGSGRSPRKGPKSKPIWCGQMSQEDRQLILENTKPDQRRVALLALADSNLLADSAPAPRIDPRMHPSDSGMVDSDAAN